MKSFKELLSESKKTYAFKIGIAGVLPEGCEAQMKTSLAKFGLSELSKGKKTPIQERPLDFPRLHNMEVTYWDVNVSYPTTPQVLGEYVANCCGLNASQIVVRNPNDPLEEYQAHKTEETYETMLTKEDMGGESAQASVGGNRVMDLLKELETARKERDNDPAAAAPKGDSKDIGDSESSKSVIGG
jgi:hypothetical protein